MILKTDYKQYHEYLLKRSGFGFLYRKFYLYPRLSKYLNGNVLDIGCGIGDFLKYYPGAIGADINQNTVIWCRKQGLQVEQMEPDRLPFAENSFDTIVMDNVLEHIEEPRKIIIEIKRVLRVGGIIMIGVPGIKGYASDPDHKVFYTKELLLKTLQLYGFQNEKLFGMPFNLEQLSKWLRQYCIYGIFRNV